MKLIVNPHKIQLIQDEAVNEKEININKCEFEFNEEITDDFVKEAYFTLGSDTYKKVIVNNECAIPQEVLAKEGTIELGVVAYLVENNEEIKRYNPTPVYFKTDLGSLKEAQNSEEITPSEMEQYQQALQSGLVELDNALDDLQDKVDSGYFKGDKGDPGLTQQEVQDLIDASIEELGELGFTPTVVQTLPIQDIDTHTIYLVPKQDGEQEDAYDEWLYINNNWEHIGSTSVDLSNYYTKSDVDNKIIEYPLNITSSSSFNSTELANLSYIITQFNHSDVIAIAFKHNNIFAYLLPISAVVPQESTTSTTIWFIGIGWGTSKYEISLTINGIWSNYEFIATGGYYTTQSQNFSFIDKVQTITNTKIFNVLPQSSAVPTADNQFTNKKYVDDITGTLSNLTTTDKTSLVSAINEVASTSGIDNTIVINVDSSMSSSFNSTSIATTATTLQFNSSMNTTLSNLLKGLYDNGIEEFNVLVYDKNVSKSITFNVFNHNKTLQEKATYYSVLSPAMSINTNNLNVVYYELRIWVTWNGDIPTITQTFLTNKGEIPYALKASVLQKNNTTAYTPTNAYNPATKKYVDDSIASAITDALGGSY